MTDAPVWEPPRLVSVVRDGQIQGEFEFEFGSHFERSDDGDTHWVKTARRLVVYIIPTPPHLPQPPFFSGRDPTLSNSRMKKVER